MDDEQPYLAHLYPPIRPYDVGMLDTEDGHRIYYELSGNPEGRPCVVLHGGPGGATSPEMRRYFNPAHWKIILFDQRGCGKSVPHAGLENNTTWDIVADMERLRIHLGVESWSLFGGSWGSTLALTYAITHPERVTSMILRGIFLVTQAEVHWFYQEGASWMRPEAWEGFCAPITKEDRIDMISAYYHLLTGSDEQQMAVAATAWSQWESDTMSVRGRAGRPGKFEDVAFTIAFARIECHYFVNRGFFDEDDWIFNRLHRLADLPCWIIQGRHDVVTPMATAWRVAKKLPKATFWEVEDAGHTSTEPGIAERLVAATNQAAQI